MIKNFIKYQSLGNNFVVYDWYAQPEDAIQKIIHDASWRAFVIEICNRNTGVGADGVLILKRFEQDEIPEMLIFTADGTQAESCLNGLRCVTHYLVTQYGFPAKFSIKLGKRMILCELEQSAQEILITNNVGPINYEGIKTVTIVEGTCQGHVASIGNPHFIIFEKIELPWLQQFGALLESHEAFPNKSNIEFVWEEQLEHTSPSPSAVATLERRLEGSRSDVSRGVPKYHVLVYERGCGITQACSSGAAAIVGTLLHLNKIEINQKIELMMLGGSVVGWVDQNKNVFLTAGADIVFTGTLS
jgi:diaminopimelate epimerase